MDDRERALQDKLAARLLDADPASRDAAYREVYEAFHPYLRTDSGRRSFLYRKRPLAEARRPQQFRDWFRRFAPTWCRHHDEEDGTLHLQLYSDGELADLFRVVGFSGILSPFFKTEFLVDVRHKGSSKEMFHRLGLRRGWRGTGLSSVVLCGTKGAA